MAFRHTFIVFALTQLQLMRILLTNIMLISPSELMHYFHTDFVNLLFPSLYFNSVSQANDVPLSPTLLEQALEIYEESATNTDNNTICPCQHCQPHESRSLDSAMQKTIKVHEVSDYDRKLSNILLLMFVLSLSIATAISLWPY